MKIISKFKDYYDIGLSMGVDETITYVRNTQSVESDPFTSGSMLEHLGYQTARRIRSISSFNYGLGAKYRFILGFCGKLYPVLMVPNGKSSRNRPFENFDFHYSWDDNIHPNLKKIESYYNEEQYDAHFRKYLSLTPREDDYYFHKFKTPIFVIPSKMLIDMWGQQHLSDDYHTIRQFILHPILSDIQFHKVVDSYTAYQEIMSYITGVLSVNKIPPVEIADTDMRDAKGFDERSFKKEPTKKYRQ